MGIFFIILAVVIRYFGGIKLGSPGLVRAYTNSVTDALDNNELYFLSSLVKVMLCSYS